MKLFKCQACGNAVYFENAACVVCRHRLGFAPDLGVMSALELAEGQGVSALADPSRAYRILRKRRRLRLQLAGSRRGRKPLLPLLPA